MRWSHRMSSTREKSTQRSTHGCWADYVTTMPLLLLLLLLPSTFACQHYKDCESVNLALSVNRACRCFNDQPQNEGSQMWIGCTRAAMPQIYESLKSLRRDDGCKLSLEKLYLWDNAIPIILPLLFAEAPLEPTKLTIESSMVGEMQSDALKPFVGSLRTLELRSNGLSSLGEGIFKDLHNLTSLDLSGNRISRIQPDSFSELTSLQSLFLYRNNISVISDAAFSKLADVTSLSLAENALRKLDENVFTGLPRLEDLNLENNQLESIHHSTFSSLQSLKTLRLSNNRLTSLTVKDLPALEKLHLSGNAFEDLEKLHLSNLPSLKILLLDSNRITTIPPDTFAALPSLTVLSLTGNRLVQLHPQTFQRLGELRTLALQQNSLQNISHGLFSSLQRLQRLFLSYNRLLRLDAAAFEGLDDVEVLSLSHNRLASLPHAALQPLSNLRKLLLNNNELSVIEAEMVEGREGMQFIDVSGNPLICSCNHVRLFTWIQDNAPSVHNVAGTQCQGANDDVVSTLQQLIEQCDDAMSESLFGEKQPRTSSSITALGIVLAVLTLFILSAVACLVYQQHLRRPLGGGVLSVRVPSDMQTLLRPSLLHPSERRDADPNRKVRFIESETEREKPQVTT